MLLVDSVLVSMSSLAGMMLSEVTTRCGGRGPQCGPRQERRSVDRRGSEPCVKRILLFLKHEHASVQH